MKLNQIVMFGILCGAARHGYAAESPAVIQAAKIGDVKAAAALVKQRANLNATEVDGTTALHWAAHRNDLAMADLLLKAGANATLANAYGITPLAEAVANGSPKLTELLLTAKADPNAPSAEGEPPILLAARSGSVETVKILLAHGANPNVSESWKGQTALMWAAAANRAEVVTALLEKGADPNAHSKLWPREKIKRPANGNLVSERPQGGLTPLLYAAREGSIDAARALIQGKADLNFPDPDGTSPVVVALLNAHYDLAALLLESGANPNTADKYGRAALYAAIDMNSLEPSVTRPAPKENDKLTAFDVVRLALNRGANPNAQLTDALPGRGLSDFTDPILRAGVTPFFRAAKTGDVAAMRLLLDHKADPMIATKDKVTPLMAASGFGWRYGDSQVPEAAALAAVKLCIELGMDVNAANEIGETPLHGAALRGADSIAQYLFDHGAKLDAKDKRNRTPLAIAAGDENRGSPGYPSTAALLRKLMGDPAQRSQRQ
jgi:ankyrin repeat protein